MSLITETDRFSDDAWDLLLAAQDRSRGWGHRDMDVEHLFQAMVEERPAERCWRTLQLDPRVFAAPLEAFCADQPRDGEDTLYLGSALDTLLNQADLLARRWGEPLIDVPQLLLALAEDPRIGEPLCRAEGLGAAELIRRLRPAMAPPRSSGITVKQGGPPQLSGSARSGATALRQQAPLPVSRRRTAVAAPSRPVRPAVAEPWDDLSAPDPGGDAPQPAIPRLNGGNGAAHSPGRESAETLSAPAGGSTTATPTMSDSRGEADAGPLEQEPAALERFCRDLTALAAAGDLDPVMGRDQAIRRVIQVLSRRGRNNPVLVGPAGVGKTAIAHGLAQRIATAEVPEALRGIRLLALDPGSLIAGAKYRGQFEERLRQLLEEFADAEGRAVLFIDDLRTVLASDRSSSDASSLLKPALARGELRCIAATSAADYRHTVERDPALERRFQQIVVREPSQDDCLDILRGLKERYELHHGVVITDQALGAAIRLASRYISDRCLPDKAIDLIDEAAAQLRMDVSSKPSVVEAAERELRRVELALLAAEQSPQAERVRLQQERNAAAENRRRLSERWQQERAALAELRALQRSEEEVRHRVAEADRIGDLEEAARLQYDSLRQLERRRAVLEEALHDAQDRGEALLREQVEEADVADVVGRWTGIPVQRLLASERRKLLELHQRLAERVLGQDEAVEAVAAAIRRARAGMKDVRRPVGSFLFLGPTGVGKTELARALAAALFDEEEALLRLDMSEYMERNAVARLLGAPPGYVGYEAGGQLTEAIRARPYAVVLLDEVEKAHPDVFNLLLQVLDDGRLTDSQGRAIDFRHTVVVMTSNLASRDILASARHGGDPDTLAAAIDRSLASQFRPEFLNRIDEVIRFQPLGREQIRGIVDLRLADLAALLREQGLRLQVDGAVADALASDGYNPEYGARPLARLLRRHLENPLATELLEERFAAAEGVRVLLAEPPAPASAGMVLRFQPLAAGGGAGAQGVH